jgi:hypothetical protein
MMSKILYFTNIPDASVINLFEEMHPLPVLPMVPQCTVTSTSKLHVSPLPLPGVPKRTVRPKLVTVAVNSATLTREQKDNWMLRRGGHASLTLSAETLVYISPPIVDMAYFKHCQLSQPYNVCTTNGQVNHYGTTPPPYRTS